MDVVYVTYHQAIQRSMHLIYFIVVVIPQLKNKPFFFFTLKCRFPCPITRDPFSEKFGIEQTVFNERTSF